MKQLIHRIAGIGTVLMPLLLLASYTASPDPSTATATAKNRYVGAKVCKNCHAGKDKGDIHAKWEGTAHANAYKTLANAEAKAIGKKLGIADPQKSDKCLECHVTAFGVDKKDVKRSFKIADGVQCESCHGPGEDHFKVRFKESQTGGTPAPVSAGEIEKVGDASLCIKCHNDKSPTYKEFCYKERMKKIRHLDPRKTRTEEEIKAMESKCSTDCPKCSKEKGTDK